jgi:hypothetical protein
MSDQLSATSVRTYHTTPEGFAPARNRILRQRALLFAGVVVFIVVLQYGAFADSLRSGSISSILPAVFVLIFLLGTLALGVKIGNKRIRDSWRSYELIIGEDFLIRKMKDHQEIEIRRSEITAIKEADNGLRVQTKQKGREIGIPSALVGYEDAKSRLRQWGGAALGFSARLGTVIPVGCRVLVTWPCFNMRLLPRFEKLDRSRHRCAHSGDPSVEHSPHPEER